MGSKVLIPMFFTCMSFMVISLPPIFACGGCCPTPTQPPHHCPSPPSTPRPHPPSAPRPQPPSAPQPHPPPHRGRPKVSPPLHKPPPGTSLPPPVTTPPIYNPPGVLPPIINPPGTTPPYPPYRGPPGPPSGGPPGGGGGGGGGPGVSPPPPPATQPKCPINALKLGLCVDVLGGLVRIGIGDPIENVCCPVLKGLLELEAAICLCTTIRLKLLNLNIFLPLALQVLATCGLTPPPGFVCPPLV
ncbi:hypothetical protein RHSIM_Rhsim07G0106200 [Rhododendron simsii]|uniref:Hydrophobic seed protein domain-containing protein n=1 Tax=Rhododendron simsii TaxID=118357 RepID=A0A834LJU6_RHOSS|nr:hypothetical protein RHSIM_Rhsim07G0106200 [Rhododendron simsii]